MEKEAKNQRAMEPDFVLQWGSRNRHRCVKGKSKDHSTTPTSANGNLSTSKFSSDSIARKRNSDPLGNERKPSQLSPEKEDRFYATRSSVVADKDNKVFSDHNARNDNGAALWPKLFLSLSSKEKEEDFMAFRGCKPPQRPKRRAKLIQRNVLLACPGTWLSDLSYERYEVREKKASKKKPRGLKAIGNMDSESR